MLDMALYSFPSTYRGKKKIYLISQNGLVFFVEYYMWELQKYQQLTEKHLWPSVSGLIGYVTVDN